MSKLTRICLLLLLIIILSTSNYGNQNSSYQSWTDYEIKTRSLRSLIIHRAEIYASKGYIFKDEFLRSQMQKRSWYKPSVSYSYSQFSMTEKIYINKLSNRIDQLKEDLLSHNKSRLQRYLYRESMVVKFCQLADLNSDGQYDLIAICGKKFQIQDRMNIQKLQDESYKHYYNKPNELYLVAWGDSIYGTFLTKIKISEQPFGIAEYVNALKTGYYIGNGKPQIKVILHSFPLKSFPSTVHKQNLYIFSLDEKQLKNIFSYETYVNNIEGNREKTIQYHYQFKNINGDQLNEIVLKKEIKITDYYSQKTVNKNYSEKIYRTSPFYFKYDMVRKEYKQ